MRPASGSFLWLLAHDLRLSWRMFLSMFGGAKPLFVTTAIVGGIAALHLVAWAGVLAMQPLLDDPAAAARAMDPVFICLFSWMVAQSVFGSTRALFDRGDLDLLLGSPLPARRVMAAKLTGIFCNTFGSAAFLLLPLAHTGAIVDGPRWLAIYPILISMALVATALALVITIGLFFLVGARRARTVTHVLGALIGGGFVLAVQILAIVPEGAYATISAFFEPLSQSSDGQPTVLRQILDAPIAALFGSLSSMAAMLAAGLFLFAAAIAGLGDRFARASLVAAGAGASTETGNGAKDIRFRGGIGSSMRRKEWRLLRRDPGLFSQLGLQIVYTVPLVVVLLRSDLLPTAMAIAPALVVITAQIAASLAWIAVSGEDAPELIASAPISSAEADRLKLSAIAAPVTMIVALPLLSLAILSPFEAALTAILASGAAASTALVNLWHPMPGNRRGMLRRHQQSKVVGLIEHALSFLWAIVTVMALVGSLLAAVPLTLVGVVLWLCHGKVRRQKRTVALGRGHSVAPTGLSGLPAVEAKA